MGKAERQLRRRLRKNLRRKRIEGRFAIKEAKLAKKYAKKMQKAYGDMSPEDVNALNSIAPILPKMAEELEATGVQVSDPSDPVEVAVKYANANPAIEDVMPQEEVDAAYNQDPESESFESFNMEKFKKAAGSIFTGAVAGIKDYTNKIKQTPPDKRTPQEQQLLNAEKSVEKGVLKGAKNSFLSDYGLPIILLLLVFLYIKSK